MKSRVWEIDFLRGIALLLMVVFHLLWNLNNFYGYPIDYNQGIVNLIGRAALFLFIAIAGVSCYFSRNNMKRVLKIFGAALLVTAATYIFDPRSFIIFGVLHFIGVNVLLFFIIKRLKVPSLVALGTAVIIIGLIFANINMPNNLLMPLGLTGQYFTTLDYVPIFPYSGIFIYGVALAKTLYPEKRSLFKKEIRPNPISYMGKRTLRIYLFHQPAILAVLAILHNLNII